MFRCSWKFSAGKTQRVMFHVLSSRIFRKLLVNSKQPLWFIYFSVVQMAANIQSDCDSDWYCLDWLSLRLSFRPGGYSTKISAGRLRPEVQPRTLLYTIFKFPPSAPKNRPRLWAENYLVLEIQLFTFKFTFHLLFTFRFGMKLHSTVSHEVNS